MQDYVVGFQVFDGRSLQSEDGGLCDPFVVVECCGLSYQTETLENRATSSLVPWNQGCIWPNVSLSPAEFNSASIVFYVYARYWWSRNYLIGKASLQLSFVNNRKRHLYARRWLCLRREDDPRCTGMLNVTVYALEPGQFAPSATEQKELMEDPDEAGADGDDADDLSKAVLKSSVEAPPGNPHHVRITISRVEDLVDLGGFGGPPSPYVTVEFAGCLVATATAHRVKVFTFNEEILIPVITPVYEDTIIIKLWSSNMLSPDELLAQGLISFSELRNNGLAPRWFNLYGWNTDEISDVAGIAAGGSSPDPNYFKGRLLISGRVDRLQSEEELQKATHQPARPIIDPGMIMLALLADVYMVTGAEGRNCRVEVSFGSHHKATELVTYDSQPLHTTLGSSASTAPGAVAAVEDDTAVQEVPEDVNTFTFSEKDGRVEPVLIMAPEDPLSQPYVMVNVYTDGYLQRYQRIAYAKCTLADFPVYEQGNPSKPRFIALEAMPDRKNTRTPPSVLITIEKHTSDDVVRHLRRKIKPMFYIVRAYCFLARQVRYQGMRTDTEPDSYGLRVTCAGMSKTTEMLQGPRPMWMQPLDLKVILCSDSPKEPPTIEPIAVTLVMGGTLVHSDLGKAVCVYTHMRQRDNLSQWEPYSLDPQWIKLFGGTYGQDEVGEVLIAFELMLWKFRDELRLQPREMWPQPEGTYDRTEHFCCLRKATLHFSLQGLRDLRPLPNMESFGFMSGWSQVSKPMVTVSVVPFFKEEQLDERDRPEDKQITFNYQKVKPGGDERVQADRLQTWISQIGATNTGTASNFEFLQVGTMRVLIPESRLLQPYVIIKVWEKPTEGGIAGALGYTPTLIGESLQSLNPVLPCCWLDGVSLDKPYNDQKYSISQMLRTAWKASRARDTFRQMSTEEMRQRMNFLKEDMIRVVLKVHIIALKGHIELPAFEKAEPYCTCEILSKPHSRIKTSPLGDKSVTIWNYEGRIADFGMEDDLLFCLRNSKESDETKSIAKGTLTSDMVHPQAGYEGDLALTVPGEGEVSLQIKISVSSDNQKQKSIIKLEKEANDFLNSEALPIPLRGKVNQRKISVFPIDKINRDAEETFSPKKGVEIKPVGGESRGTVQCRLEDSKEKPFVNDFWYKNVPLLRNHDIVNSLGDAANTVDWNFEPQQVFGFVKCTFKLVDGWPNRQDENAEEQLAEEEEEDDLTGLTESDDVKLKRSFEFDSYLDSFAFNQGKLHQHFKNPARVPSRVRVRLYFVKAVCIFGKAGSFADPYLTFQLGRNINVSMKNMVKPMTNTPDFYHFEERDVQLPYDSRLEVNIMDLEEMSDIVGAGGMLIGSTVIDLEDRWHSKRWRQVNNLLIVPIENRSLHTAEMPGKNRGSLEMWVEMIETTKSSDQKPSDIRKPADLEIEVRLVIWGTTGVPAVKEEYTNVKISTMLDCKEYNGEYSKTQETDVHFNSRDGRGVFAWRIVYPNIQMPVFSCAVQIGLYHSELIAGDTFIGSLNLDLRKYLEKVSKDMMARETGPTDLKFVAEKEDEDFNAKVNVSLYVLTQMEANTRKQGIGRDEPNDSPQLITPTEGREWGDYLSTFGFALPDFGLWKKLIPLLVAAAAFLVSVIIMRQMGLL